MSTEKIKYSAARILDRALQEYCREEPPAGLEERILERLERQRAMRRRFWTAAFSAAASLTLLVLFWPRDLPHIERAGFPPPDGAPIWDSPPPAPVPAKEPTALGEQSGLLLPDSAGLSPPKAPLKGVEAEVPDIPEAADQQSEPPDTPAARASLTFSPVFSGEETIVAEWSIEPLSMAPAPVPSLAELEPGAIGYRP